tara:strand:- start:626 stop:1219 length:594 start_codon:yes stop_codon:yes gene_type:complete
MTKSKNYLLLFLALSMGFIVIISNYLVQFPINHYGLEKILTYGAFSYPITFLIIDLANRGFGKKIAQKIVYTGFIVGVLLTLFVSTNFSDIISIRIAIGSGVAFLIAQSIDVSVFDKLRYNKIWFVAPFTSSLVGSLLDTFLFFSIAFYNTPVPWVTLALGDFVIKLLMAISLLVPFRLFFNKIKNYSEKGFSYKTR